jgi:hypothetical protein
MAEIDNCANHLFKEARKKGFRIKGTLSLEKIGEDE